MASSRVPFDQIYAKVDGATVASLQAFRREHPPRSLQVDGITWQYLALGEGAEAILFLHGAAGAYDIWWQQLDALQDGYRLITVTYPAVPDLQACGEGLVAILAEEGVDAVTVVGTSLGGYLAQYLVTRYPDRVKRAVFANTFAPGERSARTYGRLGRFLPFLPESLVMRTLRRTIEGSIYPAAGHSELVRAYLLEQSYGEMSKAQLVARGRCAITPFAPADLVALGIPALILEADNDPLVPEVLREELKATYPTARARTLHGVGHFSYLNEPQTYTQILQAFLEE